METPAEKGLAVIRKLFGDKAGGAPLPQSFARMTVEHLFGDVWNREGLALAERSLITCTVLVALGREHEQRLHFRGARNLGIPREKLEEVITHVAHYAGWPVAVTAFRVLSEVWAAMDDEAKSASGTRRGE
jgi:4-carboxymuconolactone decarboxylase